MHPQKAQRRLNPVGWLEHATAQPVRWRPGAFILAGIMLVIAVGEFMPYGGITEWPLIMALPMAAAIFTTGAVAMMAAANLVEIAASAAVRRWGLAPSVRGIILGVGTSLPELFSATLAVWSGQPPALIIGALVGSNLFNIGVIYAGAVIASHKGGHGGEVSFPIKGAVLHIVVAGLVIPAVLFPSLEMWIGLLAVCIIGIAATIPAPVGANRFLRLLMAPPGEQEADSGFTAQTTPAYGRYGILRERRAVKLMALRPYLGLVVGLAALAFAVSIALGGLTVGGTVIGLAAVFLGILVAMLTSTPEALVSIPGAYRNADGLDNAAGVVVGSSFFNLAIAAVLMAVTNPASIGLSFTGLAMVVAAAVLALWLATVIRRKKTSWPEAVCVLLITTITLVATAF